MALTLKLISPDHLIDGQAPEYTFNELGGTIGRKPMNDFVLLDPERYISGKHALIEFNNGHYFITDTSTNGVFINDSKTPLGQGNTAELMSGDKITIGTYQLLAHISTTEQQISTPAYSTPQESTPASFENPLDSLVSNSTDIGELDAGSSIDPLELLGVTDNKPAAMEPAPGSSRSVDSPEIDNIFGETEPLIDDTGNIDDIFSSLNHETFEQAPPERQQPVTIDEQFTPPNNFIPEDWDINDNQVEEQTQEPEDKLIDKSSEAAPAEEAIENIIPAEQAPVSSSPKAVAEPEPPITAPQTSTNENALIDAFFKGCQLDLNKINITDNIHLMHKLGELTRLSTHGLMQALQARATIKSGFRVSRTTIAPTENNPLKFSVTDEEALQILLSDDRKGYMPATQAFKEGFADLQTHQLALMAGLQATISTIISQFNPEQLERSFDSQSSSGFMLGQKKSRNWEQYIDFYNRLSERFQDDFQNVYGEEFAKAYEEQVAKLTR